MDVRAKQRLCYQCPLVTFSGLGGGFAPRHLNRCVSSCMLRMMTFRFSLFLLVFGFLAFFAPRISAQDCPVEYGYQGTYNFARKTQSFISVRKFNEISPTIQRKIEEQLKARVGEQFFKKLRFDYGSAEDFDSASPLKANDVERIDGYDFVFKFSDKGKGLKTFYFKVVANATGNIIEDLALPDIASNPQKANLISCKQALAIASKNGFPLERSSIYFVYDWKTESFTWSVHDSQAVEPDEPLFGFGQGTYRKISIEADTGKVLKIYKETIIV